MAAIHRRFRGPLLDRLGERLGNLQGEAAVLCREPDVSGELAFKFGLAAQLEALDDRKWDSLVCVWEMWRMPNLAPMAKALTPEGRLFFVEPVSSFGLSRRIQKHVGPITNRAFGCDFECDVPQALRDVGLTPTSVDRFRVGAPLFTFVAGEARIY